jgi:hypothetical protein
MAFKLTAASKALFSRTFLLSPYRGVDVDGIPATKRKLSTSSSNERLAIFPPNLASGSTTASTRTNLCEKEIFESIDLVLTTIVISMSSVEQSVQIKKRLKAESWQMTWD